MWCFSFKSAVPGGTTHTHALAPPPHSTSRLISTATLRSQKGLSLWAFLTASVKRGCWFAFVTAPASRPKSQLTHWRHCLCLPFLFGLLAFYRHVATWRRLRTWPPFRGPVFISRPCTTRTLWYSALYCAAGFALTSCVCGIIPFSAHTNVCVQSLTQFHLLLWSLTIHRADAASG